MDTNKITIYHNSRCSKSRLALDFLTENGAKFTIVEYLKEIPTKNELKEIIQKLGIRPIELIRKGEDEYKDNFKGKELTDDQLIDAMVKFPKLIERPIVVKGEKAVIARPTEKIVELL
jgi:arsenate reductase